MAASKGKAAALFHTAFAVARAQHRPGAPAVEQA
jgi:hypothetical protein